MPATEADGTRANEIFSFIEQDDASAEWLRTEDAQSFDEVLWKWVEIALTQLVLALSDEPIEFAQAVRGDGDTGRIIVFTASTVAISEIDNVTSNQGRPRTEIVPRTFIRSLIIGGGSRVVFDINSFENRNAVVAWPGELDLEVHYKGQSVPVRVSGSSFNRYDRATPGPILAILRSLRNDLAAHAGGDA